MAAISYSRAQHHHRANATNTRTKVQRLCFCALRECGREASTNPLTLNLPRCAIGFDAQHTSVEDASARVGANGESTEEIEDGAHYFKPARFAR
jgi:hypothetical protein